MRIQTTGDQTYIVIIFFILYDVAGFGRNQNI